MSAKDIEKLSSILLKSWSEKSSTKWTIDNPYRGQCGVTSLVVQDLLGGRILKTKLSEGWHFYNEINGTRYDFTSCQFTSKINYLDLSATREEAFEDTNEEQYLYLKGTVTKLWDLK
ncbi:YunG family protein [Bacillus kexueae]|uniref:YunG family protein n=1 Tax=Aeribacillus kexueae TaxID=2078952 RepID=UPI001FAF5F96|nr:hypothetical protein [Bacillus kexueae]